MSENQKASIDRCSCVQECDCMNPEPEDGAALVSNECPVHNLYPKPNPDCVVHNV